MKHNFGCHSYFDSVEGEKWRMKDDFGCRSYFDSAEWEEREDERRLWLSFLL